MSAAKMRAYAKKVNRARQMRDPVLAERRLTLERIDRYFRAAASADHGLATHPDLQDDTEATR